MTLLDDSIAQALAANRISGRTNSYASDNPRESLSVFSYLKGGRRPLSVTTALGKHLVFLEDARRAGYAPPSGGGTYGSGTYGGGSH